MGIPVRVVDDDGVGGLQVEAEAAGARAQDEHEVLGVLHAEQLQQLTAVVRLGRPVQTQVPEACGHAYVGTGRLIRHTYAGT